MQFIHWKRQLALENAPFMEEGMKLLRNQDGVFGKEDQEDIIMEVEEKIQEMHSQREQNEKESRENSGDTAQGTTPKNRADKLLLSQEFQNSIRTMLFPLSWQEAKIDQ